MKIKRKGHYWNNLLVGLVLIVSVLSFSCTKQHKKENWKRLNLILSSSGVSSLDPVSAFDSTSLKVLAQIQEPLYQYHYLLRPFKVVPLLADGPPQIKRGGKQYVIKIKPKVLYHPHPAFKGEMRFVESQDLVNQIKRMAYKPLKSTGKWLFEGLIEGFEEFGARVGDDPQKFFRDQISGLQTPDKHTLVINLNRPSHQLPYFLAMNFVVPVPLEVINKNDISLGDEVIGTGPYYLTRWVRKKEILLTRFSNYRHQVYPKVGDRYAHTNNLLKSSNQKVPFISEIHFLLEIDKDKQWELFLNKKIDILEVPKPNIPKVLDINGKLTPELRKLKVNMIQVPGLINRWLGFNMRDPLIGNNLNLRKAIAHAIDINDYTKALTGNLALEANSLFTPGIKAYDPSQELPYEYNLKKAQEYLIKAGFSKENGPTLTYSTRNKIKNLGPKEGRYLKNQLSKIGIKLKIQELDFRDYLKKGRGGELQFFTDNWVYDYPNAQNLLQLLLSKNSPGINKSGYSNPRFDDLYKKIDKLHPNHPERKHLLKKIENVVFEDLPWIPLTYERDVIFYHQYVENYRKSSFIRNFLKYIKLKK